MISGKMPNLLAQPDSLGESGNAALGSLPRGQRPGFSVKLHRGVAFVIIIASVLMWGGLITMFRLV